MISPREKVQLKKEWNSGKKVGATPTWKGKVEVNIDRVRKIAQEMKKRSLRYKRKTNKQTKIQESIGSKMMTRKENALRN